MKSKILLVEDDQFLRELYVKLWSEQNYLVDAALKELYMNMKEMNPCLAEVDWTL